MGRLNLPIFYLDVIRLNSIFVKFLYTKTCIYSLPNFSSFPEFPIRFQKFPFFLTRPRNAGVSLSQFERALRVKFFVGAANKLRHELQLQKAGLCELRGGWENLTGPQLGFQ